MSPFLLMMIVSQVSGNIHFGILDVGQYHYNELWAQDGDSWTGLFDTGEGFELRTVQLEITRVRDFILDREGELTGKEVDVEGDDEPLALIWASEPVFEEGAVLTGCSGTPDLLPDTAVHLTAPGMQDAWIIASSRGIFMKDGTGQQRLTLNFTEEERFWGNSVRVVWAGDLDHDGRFDVILDFNPHYAIYKGLMLFLSSVAGPDNPVARVAMFIAVSC